MRVAVTGAGGFVGRAVVAALAAAGHSVMAVTRRTADLRHPADVAATLAGVDAVCHLAAVVRVRDSRADPLGTWRTNVGGTLAVLDALPPGARLVLASTAALADSGPPPVHPYGASKHAAEVAVRDVAASGALGAVSLRLANVAGPGDADRTRLLPAILAAAAGGEEFVVNGDGSAVRDLVHVADAADAFVAALAVAEPGSFRAVPVGSGRPVAVREVLEAVARVSGHRVPVRHREAADEPPAVTIDPARARDELGWTARHSALDRIVRDAWTATVACDRHP
ncbi:NAD-dependent epimerase/dehydratase family protein [Actinomycetospora flava]|uniref:NAD-dependent epimerase/dehydratase family protein n=1 Tax=Actinomycetospora flava TaxID=3129232 RepID=A0ABU8M3L7_9PSEU